MPMLSFHISGRKLVPESAAPAVVCGNSSYVLKVTFDSEWDPQLDRFAEFTYRPLDRAPHLPPVQVTEDFRDVLVSVPPLENTCALCVTVTDGVRRTVPYRLCCLPCITGIPAEQAPAREDLCAAILESLSPQGAYSLLSPALLTVNGAPLLARSGKTICCRRVYR